MNGVELAILKTFGVTRNANAIFHLSAFARFPVQHGTINCLCMFDRRNNLSRHGQIDSTTELNDYYQNH